MIRVLLFFIPAGLSLKIKNDLFGNKPKLQNQIFTYMAYVMIINIIGLFITYIYSMGKDDITLSYNLNRVSFIFLYLLISLIVAIIVPILDEYFTNNMKIKISIKRDKNVKKKNR